MMQYYKIQIVTVDESARQAVGLASLSRFDKITFGETGGLAREIVAEHRVILVVSDLTVEVVQAIASEIASLDDFMIVLPGQERDEEILKHLILMGGRVVFGPSDTISSLSLSQTLQLLERVFYGNDTENEIAADHEDLYTVMDRGTLTEFHSETGSQIETVTTRVLNMPGRLSDVCGATILFDIEEDFSILEVSEAMEIVERLLPEESSILFQTRNDKAVKEEVGVTVLLSRSIDFQKELQEQIDRSESHLEKIAIIVDAYAKGEIDGEKADHLALRNDISTRDLRSMYDLVYTAPMRTRELLRTISEKEIPPLQKEEAVADELTEDMIDTDLIEEIVRAFGLPMDEIVEIIKLKREGKVIVDPVELPDAADKKYPELYLGRNGDVYIVGGADTFYRDPNGLTLADGNDLELYERDDLKFYVDKDLSKNEVESFVKAFASVMEKPQ